jgi:hypothetical protein
MILRQLRKRHVGKSGLDDVFLTEVKNGRSWDGRNLLILDALAIRKSWVKPCFTGYEVKVDRGDFMRDHKWPGYVQYCHQFYFACPTGLIQPDELPNEVGLIWYNPGKDSLYTKRKALYRPIEISAEMLMYIVMSRMDSDRHPFFSDEREMLMAWVEDKQEKVKLGHIIGGKMVLKLKYLGAENKRLKQQVGYLEDDREQLQKIRQVLRSHGLPDWPVSITLDKVLRFNVNPAITDKVQAIGRIADELKLMIEPAKAVNE